MAYTCVLAPSCECDGCQECEKEPRRDPRWDTEYNNDDYAEFIAERRIDSDS